MQHIVLSDHPGDQIKRRQAERESNYNAAVAEYTGKLQVRQARINSLIELRTQAKEQGRHLRAAGYACEILLASLGKMVMRAKSASAITSVNVSTIHGPGWAGTTTPAAK